MIWKFPLRCPPVIQLPTNLIVPSGGDEPGNMVALGHTARFDV